MKLLFAAILTLLAPIAFPIGFQGKKQLTPEDLHRILKDMVRKADLIVVGTLSDVQPNRFEIAFHAKDGRSQTDSFDSGLLSSPKALKGQFDSKVPIAFRSKMEILPKMYWGNEVGKPRIWLLQERREPTAGFYIALFGTYPVEDEAEFSKALKEVGQGL